MIGRSSGKQVVHGAKGALSQRMHTKSRPQKKMHMHVNINFSALFCRNWAVWIYDWIAAYLHRYSILMQLSTGMTSLYTILVYNLGRYFEFCTAVHRVALVLSSRAV